MVARMDEGQPLVRGLGAEFRKLWAASAAGPQSEGVAPAEYGAAGVFAFDLQTGALKRKAVLGPDAKAAFGDLAVAPDGTVYVSDSNGALYRLPPASQTLEPFAPDVRYVSPQGLAVVADGRVLMVADYAMGLYGIDTKTQRIWPIPVPSGTTVLGIDGLSGDGTLLMATQNGVNPQRVLRLAMGEDWTRVRQVAVMAANLPQHREITLGQVAGGSADERNARAILRAAARTQGVDGVASVLPSTVGAPPEEHAHDGRPADEARQLSPPSNDLDQEREERSTESESVWSPP